MSVCDWCLVTRLDYAPVRPDALAIRLGRGEAHVNAMRLVVLWLFDITGLGAGGVHCHHVLAERFATVHAVCALTGGFGARGDQGPGQVDINTEVDGMLDAPCAFPRLVFPQASPVRCRHSVRRPSDKRHVSNNVPQPELDMAQHVVSDFRKRVGGRSSYGQAQTMKRYVAEWLAVTRSFGPRCFLGAAATYLSQHLRGIPTVPADAPSAEDSSGMALASALFAKHCGLKVCHWHGGSDEAFLSQLQRAHMFQVWGAGDLLRGCWLGLGGA